MQLYVYDIRSCIDVVIFINKKEEEEEERNKKFDYNFIIIIFFFYRYFTVLKTTNRRRIIFSSYFQRLFINHVLGCSTSSTIKYFKHWYCTFHVYSEINNSTNWNERPQIQIKIIRPIPHFSFYM